MGIVNQLHASELIESVLEVASDIMELLIDSRRIWYTSKNIWLLLDKDVKIESIGKDLGRLGDQTQYDETTLDLLHKCSHRQPLRRERCLEQGGFSTFARSLLFFFRYKRGEIEVCDQTQYLPKTSFLDYLVDILCRFHSGTT